MANRKTFNDFLEKNTLVDDDYLVGFDSPSAGGEKKFKLGDLKNFIKDADLTDIESTAFNMSGLNSDFFSGKIFHITSGNISNETNECVIELPFPMESDVRFIIVNMLDANLNGDVKIKIQTKLETGSVSLQQTFSAKGEYLLRKFDYAEIYTSGDGNWYGHGDLISPDTNLLNIKELTENYTPSIFDNQSMFHFKQIEAETITFNLPSPSLFPSGTQFYLYNFSETGAVVIETSDSDTLLARAKYLRRKFDDAVVYTDGNQWFATGDLS